MTTSRLRSPLALCCLALSIGAASAQTGTLVGTAAPQTNVLQAKPQPAPPVGTPAPSPRREPIKLKGPVRIAPQGPEMEASVDSLDLDFSGAAADALRQRARPAPVALRNTARGLIAAEAQAEDCGRYADGDRLFFADLDDDGQPEGLAIYTLEGCGGGGNNYTRSAMVLRESPTQGWTRVFDFAMGTKLVGNRVVTRMGGGTLTLAGNGEAFSSSAPPETVTIPAAGR